MDPEIVPNIESHIWLKINKKDLDPKLNIFPHHLTMSRTRLTRRRQTPWRRRLLSKFQWPWWKKDEAGTVEPLTQRRVSVLDSPTGDLGPGDTVKKNFFDLPNGNCWFYEKKYAWRIPKVIWNWLKHAIGAVMKNICMAERNMINRSRTSILGPRIRKCQEAYD